MFGESIFDKFFQDMFSSPLSTQCIIHGTSVKCVRTQRKQVDGDTYLNTGVVGEQNFILTVGRRSLMVPPKVNDRVGYDYRTYKVAYIDEHEGTYDLHLVQLSKGV